jgi:hypothetical protein
MAQPSSIPSRPTPAFAWGLIAVTGLLVLIIYLLRVDHAAGLTIDDGWYLLFAQAIARGDGFTLISSPIPALLPTYPPAWPALMSLVFLWAPDVPANVPLLKLLSIAAMLAIVPIGWRYFQQRGMSSTMAAGVTLAVVMTPAFVFLATSTLMSECVFTLAMLAGTFTADRSMIDSPATLPTRATHPTNATRATITTIAAGALAAAAVLIRSAGLPLPIAIGVLLVWRRRWRQALLFAATCAVCLAPWWWYTATHGASKEQRVAHGGSQAWTYSEQFWMRRAGDPSSGTVTVRDLPARVRDQLVDVFGRAIGGIVLPTLYRSAQESGQEVVAVGGGLPVRDGAVMPAGMGSATGTMIVSSLLGIIALIGYVRAWRRGATAAEILVPLSLLLTVTWPFWAFRFVLPLAPFFYVYLVNGLEVLAGEARRASVVRIALACVIALNLGDHALYITQSSAAPQEWVKDSRDADALFEWMRTHLKEPGYVASDNPALVYLRTGRQGVTNDDASRKWEQWKAMGVRYLVNIGSGQLPGGPHQVLYQSPNRKLWVVQI